MVRAMLEGVTYSLRDCLAIIEEQGVAVKQIRASGGGAKSAFWRQMQADVLGKTVVTMAADEGPAYGVALLAAVGAGEFKDVVEACDATVKTTRETKTNAKAKPLLRRGVSRSIRNSTARSATISARLRRWGRAVTAYGMPSQAGNAAQSASTARYCARLRWRPSADGGISRSRKPSTGDLPAAVARPAWRNGPADRCATARSRCTSRGPRRRSAAGYPAAAFRRR